MAKLLLATLSHGSAQVSICHNETFYVARSQQPPQNLPRRRLRDRVDEVEPSHLLIRCDTPGDVGHQLLCRRNALQHDERARDLAALDVLERHDGRIGNRRMREQHGFELGGRHLQPLVLDELLDAIDDVEIPVGVRVADVARMQPTVGIEHRAGLVRAIQIATHDLARPRIHSSPSAPGSTSRPVSGSTTRHSVPATTPPTDPGFVRSHAWRRDVCGGARLGHAVPLLQHAADARRALFGNVRAERRGAGEQHAHVRKIAAGHRWMLRERKHDRRHDVQHRRTVDVPRARDTAPARTSAARPP